MIDVIDKKQMYDSALRGEKMLLKSRIVLHWCFWWVLMSILCLVMPNTHILCVNALKVLSGFFCWRKFGNPSHLYSSV